MKIQEILTYFGINESEAAVYVACLELGSATAQQIAQKANITRTYFYDIAKSLNKKGLITYIDKNKKRLFSAIDPEKLREIQAERSKRLNEVLPELKAIYNTAGKKPKITFFEGLDGIKEINKDTLRYKDEIFGFTTEHFLNAEEKKLSREYIKERVNKKISARVFGAATKELMATKQKDQESLRQTKLLPNQLFHSNVEFVVYGNKIAITSYKEEFGLIIESSDIVEPLKMIFELIWRGGFVMEK